jgi:hypothetical protein
MRQVNEVHDSPDNRKADGDAGVEASQKYAVDDDLSNRQRRLQRAVCSAAIND